MDNNDNKPDEVVIDWDAVAARQKARDKDRIEPIRLGGADNRQRVESLSSGDALIPEPEAAITPVIDFATLSQYGLTRLEHRAIIHRYRHSVPMYQLHESIGVQTPHQAARVLSSALAKLQHPPKHAAFQPAYTSVQNSLRMAYREHLDIPGHRPWSLNRVNDHFRAIMEGERRQLFVIAYESDASHFRKRTQNTAPKSENYFMTIEVLKQKALAARLNHDRVGQALHALREQRDAADALLSTELDKHRAELATAIVENRPPDVSAMEKRIATLRTNAHNKAREYEAAFDARKFSESAVHEAEGNITLHSRQAALAATATLWQTYLETQKQQAERAHQLGVILAEHNCWIDLLLPSTWDDSTTARGAVWSGLRADLANYEVKWSWPSFKKVA